tara:strand:+ start:236 stop:790 length:555 start_codon:yes stop_codon:yes gene_type:complete
VIKHLILFAVSFLFIGNSYSQDKIVIKQVSSESSCRQCTGKLIVSNGKLTDSVFGGQWGYPPDYQIQKINNTDVLILDDEYGYSGGIRIRQLRILLLDKKSFLDEIYKKSIILYYEIHRVKNNVPTNYIYTNDPVIKIDNNLEIKKQVIIQECPEINDERCITLKTFEETELINLSNLVLKKNI